MGKSKFLFLFVLLVGAPVGALVLGGYVLLTKYESEKKALSDNLAALPQFDEAEVAERVADGLGLRRPVAPPGKPAESIRAEITARIKAEAKRKFPAKSSSRRNLEIMKRHAVVEPGDKVTVTLNRGGRSVSGPFLGKVYEGRNRVFINIAGSKIPLRDIAVKDHHKFDRALSDRLICEKMAEAERAWKENRDEWCSARAEELMAVEFPANGYLKNEDGGWTPASDMLARKVAEEEKQFNAQRKKQVAKLIENHRFLGLFELEPDIKK